MSDETVENAGDAVDGEGVERPQSRRRLLQAAGVAAGAVAAGRMLAPESASAADGGNFVLGTANTATSKTSLATSGAISNDGALSVTAAAADYGVFGSGASYGVVGSGPGGVLGLGSVGGVFSGSVVAINLDPQAAAGPPTGQAFRGDMAVDSTGVLFMCVAAGTPGTWIRVSHGGTRYLGSPARAYDSRAGTDGKLRPGFGDITNPRVVPITGVVAGVPANALGVFGNLAVTQEDGGGFATVWPGGAWPGTANINYNANQDLSNAFSVGLSGTGGISIAASGTTHVVIDIAGFVL
jgi:hypothetical protein